jgi:hypothetical protein
MKEHGKREEHMGGKHSHGKHHGMGKKEAGFGAKLGKSHGKSGLEGPHKK